MSRKRMNSLTWVRINGSSGADENAMKVTTDVETAAAEMAHPARHAVRGGAATLAVLALLTNAMKNRGALVSLLLLRWRHAFQALNLAFPSRSVTAVSVFVGAWINDSATRSYCHVYTISPCLWCMCVCASCSGVSVRASPGSASRETSAAHRCVTKDPGECYRTHGHNYDHYTGQLHARVYRSVRVWRTVYRPREQVGDHLAALNQHSESAVQKLRGQAPGACPPCAIRCVTYLLARMR